jgi:hypothetical protein
MRTRRRTRLGWVGVAALLAGVIAPWTSAAPAFAVATAQLQVDRSSLHASGGTCTVLTVTPTDTFGTVSTSIDTLTVTLAEDPSSAAQDVDFCVPRGVPGDNFVADTPVEAPSYTTQGVVTQPPGSSPLRNTYTAGDSVTEPVNHNQGGEPDRANNDPAAVTNSSTTAVVNTDPSHANVSGVDTARYLYTPARGPVHIGVVGLAPGAAKVTVFLDYGSDTTPQNRNNYRADSEEIQTGAIGFTVTDGGYPDSTAPYDAAYTITPNPVEGGDSPNVVQHFTVTVVNRSGDTLRGIRPSVLVSQSGANPTADAGCDTTDNSGVARCTFYGHYLGRDVLTIFVNHTGGTAGLDANEISTTAVRITAPPAAPADAARYLVLSPRDATVTAGTSKTFSATVTDVSGAPAEGVKVTFTTTAGHFSGAGTSLVTTTDRLGKATAVVSTATTDVGAGTVTAAITTAGTQCTEVAGAGDGADSSTPAGRCSDSTTLTVAPRSSTSPAPTSTGARQPQLSTSTPDIQPNQDGVLRAFGDPDAPVDLRCYSRPSTTFVTARTGALDAEGVLEFGIRPGTNTRCFVQYQGQSATASGAVVINVHTTLSLSAVRGSGVRTYIFQGRNLPRLAGQLITLYRIDSAGQEIRTANLTTDSSGIYRLQRTFTGTGTFAFRVRTSKTYNNAAGSSALYRITIR